MAEEGLTFSGWRRDFPRLPADRAPAPAPAPAPKVIPKAAFVPVVLTPVPSAAHSDDEDADSGTAVLPRGGIRS